MKRMAEKAGRAMKKAARFAVGLGRAAGRMAKVGLLALAGAATAALVGVTKMADGMDNLAKKTRAINFPIEEFQEFQFAFQQAGVDSQVFEKSLGKFTKNLGEAQGGYGAMVTALKKTNPQLLKQLKTVDSTSEAFEMYIDEIRKAPTAAKKAALASAAFGRAGLEMINGANLSSEALAELRGQMRENGVVTAEQAAKAEEFNDMWNRVKLTLLGTLRDVIAPMLPKMTEFLNMMREWVVQNKGLIRQKMQKFFKAVWENAKKLFFWVKKNIPAIKEFLREMKSVVVVLINTAKWIWNNKGAIIALVGAYAALKLAIMGAGMAQAANALQATTTAAANAANATIKLGNAMKMVGGVMAAFGAGWAIGTVLNDKFIEPVAAAIGRVEQLSGNADRVLDKRLSTMSKKTLDTAEKVLNARLVLLQGLPQTEERMSAIQSLKGNIGRIRGQRASLATGAGSGDAELQGLAGQGRGGGGAFPYSVQPPASQVVNSESTSTEKTEITIKDQTGRAEVTKGGKGGNLKLDQTGGMI
jgi:hypothetical protein